MSNLWPHTGVLPNTLVWWNDYNGGIRKVITLRDGKALEYVNHMNGRSAPTMMIYDSYTAWLRTLEPGNTVVFTPYNIDTEISNRLVTIPTDASDAQKVGLIHTLFDIETKVIRSPSPYEILQTAKELVAATRDELDSMRNPSVADKYYMKRILQARIDLQRLRQAAFDECEPAKRHLPHFTVLNGAGKKLVGTRGGVEYPIVLYDDGKGCPPILFDGRVADTFEQHALDTHDDGTPRITLIYEGKRALI